MFEVTGMGTCLVTDWKENLEDLFEPDQEVVAFKSVDEAVDKITFLRENPVEIEKIAQAGMRRTLRDHTYNHRALDMHNIITDFIKQ
jgi:spore maturation protein CgeB